MLNVTEATWESEVLKSEKPVLVDFWAEWCGPCKALAPTLDALDGEYAGAIRFVKLNTDEQPAIAQRYEIRGIPNLKLFVGGKAVYEVAGNFPKRILRKWFDEALSKAGVTPVETAS